MAENISIYTLGCKVNRYESDLIAAELLKRGYTVTDKLAVCDRYIINTCAVTNEAEKKSRQTVAKILKLNPNAKIYVIGCASQNNADSFFVKGNVEFVAGTAGKQSVIDKFEHQGIHIDELPCDYEKQPELTSLNGRTRAYIKVQDGCNSFCSYCIIPYLRGRSRSRSIEEIREEISRIEEIGIKEIVLTGINLSDYGGNGGEIWRLIDGIADTNLRVRLGSLEEGAVTEKLLKSLSSLKNFCPQFHLSLQSGSDKVLKDMNRKYSTTEFLESVNLIKKYFTSAVITTDIICGFPTETEDDFLQTIDICQKAGFFEIHVFMYSKREGTKAAKYNPLPHDIIKHRAEELTKIKYKLKSDFLNEIKGQEFKALIEEKVNGYYIGHTENYIKMYFDDEANELKENCIYIAAVKELYEEGVKAEAVKEISL